MTTVLQALNNALYQALAVNQSVYLLGEDICDPYGGAFKVTKGLSTAFPQRVLSTPVSEAGIVGMATGMALRGLLPVVEIMFGDFITLIADQLINHISKLRWMYNNQVTVPIVIRAPMGGHRGYGPTHSQSLEKLYIGIPGLHILAPCTIGDPGELLFHSILANNNPILFIEHKLLYNLPIREISALPGYIINKTHSTIDLANDRQVSKTVYSKTLFTSEDAYPLTYTITIQGAPTVDMTLVAYGYMAELAFQALHELAYKHEIFCELVIPTCISPIDIQPILNSVEKSNHLLVIEEGTHTLGWGAEVVASISEKRSIKPYYVSRMAAKDSPIPVSPTLESATLPNLETIILTARDLVIKGN